MEIIITLLFICFAVFAMGQEKKPASETSEALKEKRPVTLSLLSNYYGQDGEHGAVNGGIGSQFLESYSQEMSIYIPIRDSSAVKIHGGVDYFTSASLKLIDKYKTAASEAKGEVSKDETRKYADLSMDFANKKRHIINTPSVGFSSEYDVTSFNAGYGWTKAFPKRNISYQFGLNFVLDRWLVIYPGEFRNQVMAYVDNNNGSSGGSSGGNSGGSSGGSGGSGGHSGGNSGGGHREYGEKSTSSGGSSSYTTGASGTTTTDSANWVPVGYAAPIPVTGKTASKNGKTFPVDYRYSAAWTNTVNYVVNPRMAGSVGLDLMGQWGLLSTPFYRVYFNDGVTNELDKQVHIEKLPRQRLKAALYARYNIQLTPFAAIRTYARYYQDTWDVSAVTASAELPVKVTRWLSLSPFYRIHIQEESKYFQPFGVHKYTADSYYTSDYDLSGFTAHKYGGTLRLSPFKPLAGIHNEEDTRYIFSLTTMAVRYAYYTRSDGFSSNSVSVELNFNF